MKKNMTISVWSIISSIYNNILLTLDIWFEFSLIKKIILIYHY